MAKHMVKCYYCKEPFDANAEPFGKIGRYYAHQKCGDENNWGKKSRYTEAADNSEKLHRCLYCNNLIQPDDECQVGIGTRYAHKSCYEEYHSPDDKYIDMLYDVLHKTFGKYNYQRIEAQRVAYIKKGLTNKDIYQALYYWYIVQNRPTARANGGIGIVPYIYEDANDYFSDIEKISAKINPNTYKMGYQQINVNTEPTEYEKEQAEKRKNRFYIDPNSLKDLE